MDDADQRLADLPGAEPRGDFLAGLAVRSAVPAAPPSHRAARAVLGTAALAGAIGGGAALGATGHLSAGAVVQGSRTQAMVVTAAAARMPAPAPPRETQSGRNWTDLTLADEGSALRIATAATVAPTGRACLATGEERLRRPIAVIDHATYDGVPALVLIADGSGPVAALVTDPTCSRVLDQRLPGR
jgi:hypothetical protein